MNGIIAVLLIVGCVLWSGCLAVPVEEPKETHEGSMAEELSVEGHSRNCIPTPWGCINLNDPSYRPRAPLTREEIGDFLGLLWAKIKAKKRGKSEDESVELQLEDGKIEVGLCIPTTWGCIDISDPSLRPFGAMDINSEGRESADESSPT